MELFIGIIPEMEKKSIIQEIKNTQKLNLKNLKRKTLLP